MLAGTLVAKPPGMAALAAPAVPQGVVTLQQPQAQPAQAQAQPAAAVAVTPQPQQQRQSAGAAASAASAATGDVRERPAEGAGPSCSV